MSPAWVNENGAIEYDNSHVPWPSLKDPEIDGLSETARVARPRKPLSPEFEQYRLFNEADLDAMAALRCAFDRRADRFLREARHVQVIRRAGLGVLSGPSRRPRCLHSGGRR